MMNDEAGDETHASRRTWVISDAAAGNLRQARALAHALRRPFTEWQLRPRPPWRWLAPHLRAGLEFGLSADFRAALAPPWPELAIGCGRQAALLTRHLKRISAGRTFCVQILDPRIDTRHYDAVVAPRHDALRGENVISTLGALNPVDADWLAEGETRFPTLLRLPQPRTLLLLGGPRRDLGLDADWLDRLAARISECMARDGGSLLVAASRRTPAHWLQRLHGALRVDCRHFWHGPQDGANPYQGYLSAADRIVVTPDSVNMLSEACATGRPVWSLRPGRGGGRLHVLHEALHAGGWLRWLDAAEAGTAVESAAAPLREVDTVAAALRERLDARRGGG